MTVYGFKIKTEDNQFNTIVSGFDYCEMLEKLNVTESNDVLWVEIY